MEELGAPNGTPHNGNGHDDPEEHLDGLRKLNQTLIKRVHDMIEERTILADQLAEREQAVKDLEQGKNALESLVGNLQSKIESLKEEELSVRSEKTHLEFQVGNLRSEIESIIEDNKSLWREKTELENFAKELKTDAELKEAQLEKLVAERGDLQGALDDISRAERILNGEKEELLAAVLEAKKSNEEIIKHKEEAELAWKNEKEELGYSLADSSTKIQGLEATVEGLQVENKYLSGQVEVIGSQLNAEIETLSGSLLECRRVAEEITRDKEELETKVDGANKLVEISCKENEELRDEIASLKKELRLKDDSLFSLENEKEALHADLVNMKEEFQTVQVGNQQRKEENDRLLSQLDEAVKQLSKMKEENVSLQGQLVEAVQQLSELKDVLNKAGEDLSAENSKLKSENAILQQKVDDMGSSLAISGRKLDMLQEEHLKLIEEKEERNKEIESLHAQKSCIEKERDMLGKKLEEDSRQSEVASRDMQNISGLENQVLTIASEKNGLEDINRSLETDTMKVTLGSVVDEQDQLKEMIRDLEITLESAKKTLEDKDSDIEQLMSEIQILEKRKGNSLAWPVVAASTGTLIAAACFYYIKCSKHH